MGTTADANTKPSNTSLPAANSGTYQAISPTQAQVGRYSAYNTANGTSLPTDVDGDSIQENYYAFRFTYAELATFRNSLNTTLYKAIPTWTAGSTDVYAAAVSAANSLNAIGGDVGGGAYTTASSWSDIFGVKPNVAPVGVNDVATVIEDGSPATGNLLSNDTDQNGNPLAITSFTVAGTTYTLLAGETKTATLTGIGTLAIGSTGAYTFTPAANYAGPVPLVQYVVSDGQLTATANFSISMIAVNDAPTGANTAITINEDSPYTFSAANFSLTDANDSPANTLRSIIVTALPSGGTLKLNGTDVTLNQEILATELPNLVYTPGANGNGTAYSSLSFKVKDNGGTANGGVDTATAANTISFNVTSVNDAPVAVADTATAVEVGGSATTPTPGTNPTGNVLTNDGDVDVTTPVNGTTRLVSSASSSVTTTTTVNATATNIVGLYGTLALQADGTYTYTVNQGNATVQALASGANLSEVFTYTVKDAAGASSSSTLTVTIQGANDAPVAANDANTAKETITGFPGSNATGNVLTNDADPDGPAPKTVVGITASADAISPVTSTGLTITMNSVAGIGGLINPYKGDAVFQFNGTTWVDSGMRVNAVNTTTNTLTLVAAQGATATNITVTNNESLRFYLTVSGNNQVDPSNTLKATANTIVTGTPAASTTISVTNLVDTITVGMTVTGTGIPANTTVTAINTTNNTVTLSQSVALTTTTALSFSQGPGTFTGQYGSLVLNADGSYTYTPTANNPALNEGQTATDSFTYTMQDAAGLTSKATLTVTVLGSGTNDPDAVADTASAVEDGAAATGNVVTANDTTPGGTNITTNPVVAVRSSTATTEASVTAATAIVGQYGTLTINPNGGYSYAVNNRVVVKQ